MRILFLTMFLIISAVSCQSAPKNDVSMYDVANEMKYNEQVRMQKETMQTAPSMKKKEYSPEETVLIAGFGVAGFASQIAYIEIMEKERIESGFYASNMIETNDMLMIQAEVALPETRKLTLCVMNLNCSEVLIKTNMSNGTFFSIDFPSLGK